MAQSLTNDLSMPSKGNELFCRLCKLLVGGGTEVLRSQLDKMIPPSELPKKLQQIKSSLCLKSKNAITPPMKEALYPNPNTYGKSTDFDISLLMVLLKNVCGLQPPKSTNNWEDKPPDNDLSIEADTLRLKLCRKKLFSYFHSGNVNRSDFEKLADEIGTILIRLGGPKWNEKVEKMLSEPLSPSESIYNSELEKWHKSDGEVKEILTDIKTEMGKIVDHIQSGTGIYKCLISHYFVYYHYLALLEDLFSFIMPF